MASEAEIRFLEYQQEWNRDRQHIVLSGMLCKSSGKLKTKKYDTRFFLLTLERLGYWKNEQAYIKDPEGKLKGEIDMGRVKDVVFPSVAPKLKAALVERGAFDVVTMDEEGNEGRVFTFAGETRPESIEWYCAIKLTALRHPASLQRSGIDPPGPEPVAPAQPAQPPDAYVVEERKPDKEMREPMGTHAPLCVSSTEGWLVAGFAEAGVFSWSDKQREFVPLPGGLGTCTALAVGRQESHWLFAGYSMISGVNIDLVRRWKLPVRYGDPQLTAEMSVSSFGRGVMWLLLHENVSPPLLYVGVGPQIQVFDTSTDSLASVIPIESSVTRMIFGRFGELIYTVGELSQGRIEVWDAVAHTPVSVLDAHEGADQVTLCPLDEHHFASACTDGLIVIWDMQSHLPKAQQLHVGNAISCVCYSRKHKTLITGGGNCVGRWHRETLEPLGAISLDARSLAVSVTPQATLLVLLESGAVLLLALDDCLPLIRVSLDVHDATSMLATADSAFVFGPNSPALYEIAFIEDIVHAARRRYTNTLKARERWERTCEGYESGTTRYEYEMGQYEKRSVVFQQFLDITVPT